VVLEVQVGPVALAEPVALAGLEAPAELAGPAAQEAP
jgi:hypothetical protein